MFSHPIGLMIAATRTRCFIWTSVCLLGLLLAPGSGADDATVAGTSGRFLLKLSAKSDEDGGPAWELTAEGTFFIGGDRMLAESEYILPGGQSKERIALLVDGNAGKCYLLFRDTLNYQKLDFQFDEVSGLVSALPELEELSVVGVKKAMAPLRLKLQSLGRRRVEDGLVDAYRVERADGAVSNGEDGLEIRLYFKPETGILRVVTVEEGKRLLRVVLEEIRTGERQEQELRVPDGYYELAPRRVPAGTREEVKAAT